MVDMVPFLGGLWLGGERRLLSSSVVSSAGDINGGGGIFGQGWVFGGRTIIEVGSWDVHYFCFGCSFSFT